MNDFLPSFAVIPHPRSKSRWVGTCLSLFAGGALQLLICQGQLLAQAPVSSSPSSGQAAEVYSKAMAAFSAGDFAGARAGLNEMLTLGADGPGMESVYFSLAAAEFNLGDMLKASGAFERYIKLYPAGTKLVEAQNALAQCYASSGAREKAVALYGEIARKGGAVKAGALLSQGALLREMGKPGQAAEVLQGLVADGLQSPEAVQGALLLGSVEAERGERDKALKILDTLQGRLLNVVDNPLQLNALAFDVGDAFLHAGEFKKALTAYAMVRRIEELAQLQQRRIQSLIRKMESNISAAKADSSKVAELSNANVRLRAQVESAKTAMESALGSKDNLAALRARQASAYQSIGRYEEALLLFESMLDTKDPGVKEEALLNLGSMYARIGMVQEAVQYMQSYLSEFPKGRSADTALFILGSQQLQANAPEPAVVALTRLLKEFPKSSHGELGRFLLGNAQFTLSLFSEALESYQKYLKQSPNGEYAQEADYRSALGRFFLGAYQPALDAFEAYVKKHPEGLFAPDAEYRIAACYQAAGKSAVVAERCAAWEAKYGDHPVAGDVLALHGDALNALERKEEAVVVYRRASLCGTSDEVVQYAVFEANKILQALGRWDVAAEMFREFLAAKPDHPANVSAMYWVARATARAGKPEEAKAFLSGKIRQFISSRERDAVEQLLSQLAQLCAKAPRLGSAGGQAGGAPASGYDAKANLSKYLELGDVVKTPLVKARIWFAEAELARLTRKADVFDAALDRIASEIPPSQLGASLLAQCADRLLAAGKKDRAAEFYKELQRAFPKSELLDYVYNGLGQIALEAGKGEEALRCFVDAVDKAGAASKLKEVTLGQGKALLLLGKVDEAKAILEQVASTREWRGECTAEAVFLLGKVQLGKGDLAGAVQYFQRVFVAYQRYDKLVAQAYIHAAECFEKMNEPEKAVSHYRELASKPRLAALPEVALARKRLNLLAGEAQ